MGEKIRNVHKIGLRHLMQHAPYYLLSAIIIALGAFAVTDIWRDTSVVSQSERVQDQIDAIERQIEGSRREIARLEGVAQDLQAAISSIQSQERELQLEIRLSQLEKEKLDLDIEQTEEDVVTNQGIFGSAVADIYVEDRITPLELLAGSQSIGDFIDKQEYRASLRDQLQNSIQEIRASQRRLQDQREEVEETLAQLESQREQLIAKRAEQSRLLQQTQGEEAQYRQMIRSMETERDAALSALDNLQISDMPVAPEGGIKAGDGVGRVGSTGFSTGPHLHFEVRVDGQVTDPTPYLTRDGWLQPAGDPISQRYGNPSSWYTAGFHPGIDYAPAAGSPIRAAADGTLYRGCTSDVLNISGNAYGYMAIIDHGGGVTSVYAHMVAPEGAPCNSSYF